MEEKMNKYFERLEVLATDIQILAFKKKLLPMLRECDGEVKEIKSKIENIGNFHEIINNLRSHYQRVLEKSYKVQLAMLSIIEKQEEEELSCSFKPQSAILGHSALMPQTPRMSVAEYAQSPFIKKIKPVSLKFLDFEGVIDAAKFNTIPSYMKGRETIDEVQSFLDNVIILCLSDKYALYFKKREAIRNNQDVERWKLYHNQASYYPEKFFITQGDISSFIKTLIDAKMNRRLQMLKHLKILQEGRVNHVVSYIWVFKN